MYPEFLKVSGFQAVAIRILSTFIIALCLAATGGGAEPHAGDTTGKTDTSKTSDTVSTAPVDPAVDSSAAVDSAGAGSDSEYVFTEEYDDSHDTIAETTDSGNGKPAVPVRLPRRGVNRFLKIMAALRPFIKNKLAFLAAPMEMLRRNLRQLLVLAASLLVILMTLSYYRERKEKGRFMTTTRLSVMDKEVQRACRFIEEHFDDPELGTPRICTELVTGAAFLEALFVKELGLTVGDFIIQVRINQAKIIMRKNHAIGIADLAGRSGFTDEQEFLDRFSSIIGCNPDEYRRTIAGNTDAHS